ncbi:nociceptin receptor-like [Diadema antillarum]|uniref:nociceptin receptor-like n=1 Tax=Diadema antillarum TaxID=105358 RepID=UPI003A85275A
MDTMMTATMSTMTSQAPPEGHSLTSSDIVSITMYVVIGTFGILGNSLVMIVFGLLAQQKSQVNMFIFDQALIDGCTSVLLILFGVVNAFRGRIMEYEDLTDPAPGEDLMGNVSASSSTSSGHFTHLSLASAEFLCRFWWSRFFLFSCFAISTWNLTVMSIERYFAVMHPMTYSRNFSKKRAIVMMSIIWLVAPIMQYVPAIFQYTCGPGTCTIQESWSRAAGVVLGVVLFIWEFVLPVCIMAFVYYKIIREMRNKRDALKPKPLEPPSATSTPTRIPTNRGTAKVVHPSRNITMTLCILFAVYVICWTPNQLTFLQFNFGGPLNFTGAWYHITVTMAFLNCCVNPFIYALRLQKFQKGMRKLMVCRWHRDRREKATRITESTSMNGLESTNAL